MDIKSTLTISLAVWGAIVSTVLAFIKIKEFLYEGKPRIRVAVAGDYYVLPSDHPQNPYGDKPLISITAINVGRRPVILKKAGLLMPKGKGKKYLISVGSITSINLSEGQSHDYNILEDEVKSKGLTPSKYVAFVIDATGKYYWSHNIFMRFLKLCRLK